MRPLFFLFPPIPGELRISWATPSRLLPHRGGQQAPFGSIQATLLMGIYCASAAINPNTLTCGRLGWDTVIISTERTRLDTTCPVPTSLCMYGACVSSRGRSVRLSLSPQVSFVAHQRRTLPPSIHSFRRRGRERPSRSGGPWQAWRPTATSPKP